MSYYNFDGQTVTSIYDYSGNVVQSQTYTPTTEYEQAIVSAITQWKSGYSADDTIIPLMVHTDQHNTLRSDNATTMKLMNCIANKVDWDDISCIAGLGDVDLGSNIQLMTNALSVLPRNKRIDLWGNHDLWSYYTTNSDGQYVVDFDTYYTHFNNESFGDVSSTFSHKGNEYHIDNAHNVKYVTLAGWEIDTSKGGHSHYVISSDEMDNIIASLSGTDGCNIVLLSHCNPISESASGFNGIYVLSDGGETSSVSDALYQSPTTGTGMGNCVVHPAETSLAQMLADRNTYSSGTIKDSYGNTHSYDFSNCTGKIICGLKGHTHNDHYGYAKLGGFPIICYDAFAYQTHPFYFVNIDKTNNKVVGWKVTTDASVQKYEIPLTEAS